MKCKFAACVACLFLAACGGGGGGGGGGVTPVAAAPAPAPAAPATNATLTSLQANQSFPNASSAVTATVNSNTNGVSGVGQTASAVEAISIAYDAATQGYTLSGGGQSATFLPADKDAANSNAVVTSFSKTSGTTENTLVLANGANPGVALTYSDFAVWQRVTSNGSLRTAVNIPLVFGIPTAPGDMPRTGTASYQSIVSGLWFTPTDIRTLSGTGSLSADFAAGSTNVNMSLSGVSAISGASFFIGSVSGTGRIDAANAAFSGRLASASAYSGAYAGRFFGPGAAEAGAAFNLSNGAGSVVGGVIIGHR